MDSSNNTPAPIPVKEILELMKAYGVTKLEINDLKIEMPAQKAHTTVVKETLTPEELEARTKKEQDEILFWSAQN